MKRTLTLLFGCALLMGCAGQPDDAATTDAPEAAPTLGEGTENPGGQTAEDENAASDPADANASTGAAIESATSLTPDNTKIEFVGKHTDKTKDDRVGTFERFAGTIQIDPEGRSLSSISIEIEADSLTTAMPPLTKHLKSTDFLEVKEYPTLSFESTSITTVDDSSCTVTGTLKLHGQEQEISFPATVDLSDGLQLTSEFVIDRTDFGIDYGVDQVEKEVSITVVVGNGA